MMRIYNNNILLAEVTILDEVVTVLKHNDHVKLGCLNMQNKQEYAVTYKELESFLSDRCIPRHFGNEGLSLLGGYNIKSSDDVFTACKKTNGRLASDNIWIQFSNEDCIDTELLFSPGNRVKAWKDGVCQRYDTDAGESLMEVSASRLASAYGLDTVMYDLTDTGSSCMSYLGEGDCSVSVADILAHAGYEVKTYPERESLLYVLSDETGLTVSDLSMYFNKLCVFDFIIANSGRSFHNVDFILHSDGSYSLTPYHGYSRAFFGVLDGLSYKKVGTLSKRYKGGLFSRKPLDNFSSLSVAKDIADDMYSILRGTYKSLRHLDRVLQPHARIAEYRLDLLLKTRS